MTEYSFWERISTIFDMVISSTFFISLLVIIILTIVILIVNSKVKSKIPKYLSALAYVVIMVYVIIKYGSYVLSINDSFIEKVFSAMYFPNLITYLCMLMVTIFILITTFISKNYSFVVKIGNIVSFSLMWFLFVLILDVVKSNNIDIYDVTSIYSDSTLMILLQASTYIFFIWMGLLLMNFIVRKITFAMEHKKNNNININNNINNQVTVNVSENDPTDEIRDYSDAEFQAGYVNLEKKKKYDEYREILNHKDIDG